MKLDRMMMSRRRRMQSFSPSMYRLLEVAAMMAVTLGSVHGSAGCESEPGLGSESHFLTCSNDSQCPVGTCIAGFCEKDGERVLASSGLVPDGRGEAGAAESGSSDAGGGGGWGLPAGGGTAGRAGTGEGGAAGNGAAADGAAGNGAAADGAAGNGAAGDRTGAGAAGVGLAGSRGLEEGGSLISWDASATDAESPERPCGHPPIRFRIMPTPGVDRCARADFITAFLPYNDPLVRLAGSADAGQEFAPIQAEGVEFVWGGQVKQERQMCTDTLDDTCQHTTEYVCLAKDAALQTSWRKNAAGAYTVTFLTYPVSQSGTCASDLITVEVPLDLHAGGTVQVSTGDFPMPTRTGGFSCGDITCTIESEYCEARPTYGDAGVTYEQPKCLAYPQACLQDHTCACVRPYLTGTMNCSGTEMAGATYVLWPVR